MKRPNQARREQSRWKLVPFFGLTLLLHLFLVMGGVVLYLVRPPGLFASVDDEPLDVAVLDSSDEAAQQLPDDLPDVGGVTRQAQAQPPQAPPEEQKKVEEEQTRAPGQVVDVPQPAEEKAPEHSKYVSEYNTSVEKESKSRSNGKVGAAPGPKAPPTPPAPPASAPSPSKEAQAARPAQPATPGPPGPLVMRTPSEEHRAPSPSGQSAGAPADHAERAPDGAQQRSPDGALPEKNTVPDRAAPGEQRSGGGQLSMRELMPSDKQVMRAISGGGGGTNDYLRDVDEGETTALNSKKWKFASFFNRIKRTVAEHWRPDVEYRRRDPSGNVYGLRDRITVLRVSLRPDGSLADVQVEQPCGVDFLDDEALQAFRQAQPFPNPPRQLVDENGKIQFRFAFIFEISSTPTFKVFRYN